LPETVCSFRRRISALMSRAKKSWVRKGAVTEKVRITRRRRTTTARWLRCTLWRSQKRVRSACEALAGDSASSEASRREPSCMINVASRLPTSVSAIRPAIAPTAYAATPAAVV
jgi:hypothetical protein